MPFTLSHVSAVVPLMASASVRRYLDPWALALGSMAPDLPLFLPFVELYRQWHSPTGVLLYSIPVTLTLFVVFQWVCRDPLTALLPPALAGKVALLPRSTWRRLPALAAGAVTGFASHVLWDSFTHSWHRAYWDWAWLDATVHGPFVVYHVLQHSSSAIGLAVLLWWGLRSLSRQEARAVPDRLVMSATARRAILTVTFLGTCLAGLAWPFAIDPPRFPGGAGIAVKAVAGVIAGCCLILITYATLWHLNRALSSPERSPSSTP